MKTMMKCGHTANAVTGDNKPVCVICLGIVAGATEPDEAPDLTGRTARCTCRAEQPSSTDLPFFEHRPNLPYDSYYCGCYGWN